MSRSAPGPLEVEKMARWAMCRATARRIGAVWLVGSGALGCDEAPPAVPFTLSASVTAAPEPAPAPAPTGSFAPAIGRAPEAGGKTAVIDGKTFHAPAGKVYRRVLPLDADGDGVRDLLAWVEAANGARGELVFARGGEGGAEVSVARLPAELDREGCVGEVMVAHVAQGLAGVDVARRCGEQSEQWLGVVRLGEKPELRLDVRVGAPLRLSLGGADRDGDGRDDVVLTARLRDDPEDAVGVALPLLDRPAGFAWDPTAPQASFAAATRGLLGRAEQDPDGVVHDAERVLRIAGAVCAELGESAIRTHAGAIRCGDGATGSEAIEALAAASLARGELAAAAALADRLAARDEKAAARLEKRLAQKVPRVAPTSRRLAATPAVDAQPLSPLAFDAEGGLLVITEGGVVRSDLGTLEEAPSPALPWPRGLAYGSGDASVEIVGASWACAPRRLVVDVRARGAVRGATLPAFAPLLVSPEPCRPGVADLAALRVEPASALVAVEGELFQVGWGPPGAIVARAPLPASGGAPSHPGAGRSSDGAVVAVALARSVLVARDGKAPERWRSDETRGLGHCVPRADGDRVACIAGEAGRRSVVLLARP